MRNERKMLQIFGVIFFGSMILCVILFTIQIREICSLYPPSTPCSFNLEAILFSVSPFYSWSGILFAILGFYCIYKLDKNEEQLRQRVGKILKPQPLPTQKILIENYNRETHKPQFPSQEILISPNEEIVSILSEIPISGYQPLFPPRIILDSIILEKKDEHSVACKINHKAFYGEWAENLSDIPKLLAKRKECRTLKEIPQLLSTNKGVQRGNVRTDFTRSRIKKYRNFLFLTIYVLFYAIIYVIQYPLKNPTAFFTIAGILFVIAIVAIIQQGFRLDLESSQLVPIEYTPPYTGNFKAWDITPYIILSIATVINGFVPILLYYLSENPVGISARNSSIILPSIAIIFFLLLLIIFSARSEYRHFILDERKKRAKILQILAEKMHRESLDNADLYIGLYQQIETKNWVDYNRWIPIFGAVTVILAIISVLYQLFA